MGHIISSQGLSVDPNKVHAIVEWKGQTTVTEIWSFLCLAGYYRRFLEKFSMIATPLTALTKKVQKFDWMPKCKEAYLELKNRLTSAPILILPNPNKAFMVYIDALGFGLWYVLM